MLSYSAAITIYAFSILCSLVVLFMSIYVRKAPKSLWFSYMSLSLFVFTVGYYFEITSMSETSAIVATKIQYLGISYITAFLLLFICEYCGKKIKTIFIAALMVVPTITLLLVLQWPANNLYYKKVVFVTDTVVPHLRVTGAFFYYVFFAYTYLFSLVALIVVFMFYKKSTLSIRKQSVTLIVAIIIPVAGSIINVFRLTSWPLDLTPIVMSLTCILLGYSFFRQGLYRIVPVAREQIVESMSDGFILVDMQGRFVDSNSAAVNLFPLLRTTSSGTKIDEIEELAWLIGSEPTQSEFSMLDTESNEPKHYRVSQTVICSQNQKICNCFMIFDITDAKQLLNEVSNLAERDSLTGLVHRGTFYDKGWHLLQNAGSACLFMMDLDYFKNVNDQYGHLKGDEVLKEAATTLSKCFRGSDLLARYGGEEFCVLLPSLDITNAFELAERVRKRIEACEFQSENNTFNVTVSIGIAKYDSAIHTSFEDLVSEADAALYSAKNAGRNIVVIANS